MPIHTDVKSLLLVQKFNFDQNLSFRHIWIFAPKMEDILEYSVLIIEF